MVNFILIGLVLDIPLVIVGITIKTSKKFKQWLKEKLWTIGLHKYCPWCGSNLCEVGYVQDFCWQAYRCGNERCEFGK